MREYRLRNAVLAALAPIGVSLGAASMANAQLYTNTYDTSSSITSIKAGVYNGSSENWRFDYGGGISTGSHSNPAWSSAEDNDGDGGGSVKLSWTDSEPAGGSSSAAFTTDLFATAQSVTAISFDLFVAPSSPVDSYGGYGYFQMFNRNASYGGFNTLIGEELSVTPGDWTSISATFATPVQVRALTWQDFNDPTRDMNGVQTWYIDDLSITYQVPEPASLGLLGVGVPALLMRRRSKVKTG